MQCYGLCLISGRRSTRRSRDKNTWFCICCELTIDTYSKLLCIHTFVNLGISALAHLHCRRRTRTRILVVFTLPNTDTDTDTNTDKMGLQPSCICVSVCVGQYEHFHSILYNSFSIGVCVCVGQCEHSIIQCSHLVWNRNLSWYLYPSPAMWVRHNAVMNGPQDSSEFGTLTDIYCLLVSNRLCSVRI